MHQNHACWCFRKEKVTWKVTWKASAQAKNMYEKGSEKEKYAQKG